MNPARCPHSGSLKRTKRHSPLGSRIVSSVPRASEAIGVGVFSGSTKTSSAARTTVTRPDSGQSSADAVGVELLGVPEGISGCIDADFAGAEIRGTTLSRSPGLDRGSSRDVRPKSAFADTVELFRVGCRAIVCAAGVSAFLGASVSTSVASPVCVSSRMSRPFSSLSN